MTAVTPQASGSAGPLPFAITGSGELTLANNRTGATTFTVTNLTGRPLRVRLQPKGENPAHDGWYRMTGDTEVPLAVGATISVEVKAKVPNDVAEGSYPMFLRAVDEGDPELLTDGQPVAVAVPKSAPAPAFPIVPVLIAVLVLLLAGGGAIWWFLIRKDPPKVEPQTPMAAPVSRTAPVVSGTARVGETLSTTTGDWDGAPTFSYSWISCDEMANNCAPIPGATASSYLLAATDLKQFVRVKVTGSNAAGMASVESKNKGPVAKPASNGCLAGWVPREARPQDRVCVSPETRAQVIADNAVKEYRWVPGPYGPHTCLNGYVWREAYVGDDVCVVPERRSQAWADNAAANSRKDPDA